MLLNDSARDRVCKRSASALVLTQGKSLLCLPLIREMDSNSLYQIVSVRERVDICKLVLVSNVI